MSWFWLIFLLLDITIDPSHCVIPSLLLQHGTKVICYYTNWSIYYPNKAKFSPSDINPQLCTHIIYSYAWLDKNTLLIIPSDPELDIDQKNYDKVTSLKSQRVKVLIGLGGWTDSHDGDKYSRLVSSSQNRKTFIQSVLKFIQDHNFDGIDLNYEFPSTLEDKQGFSLLVSDLRQALGPHLLLSCILSKDPGQITDGYDIPSLSTNLDWITVLTFDYGVGSDPYANFIAPLHNKGNDIDTSIKYWIQAGLPKGKIILGIPLYGASWVLQDPSNIELPAKAKGPGPSGLLEPGRMAYWEICEKIEKAGWREYIDLEKGSYALGNGVMVTYDARVYVVRAVMYIKQMGLGGAMVYSLELDDFLNMCSSSVRSYPILRTVKTTIGLPLLSLVK